MSSTPIRVTILICAILATACVVGVLVFQYLEFDFYRAAPSVWPATLAK